MRILLVDASTRTNPLHAFVQSEGIVVESANAGEEALDLLRHYPFDVVVLDLALPDMDGVTLISRLRLAGHHTPVLALLSSASIKHRLAALSAGADDVVGHDTDRTEILARMHAIFRRSRGFSQPAIQCGQVTLNQEHHEVTIAGRHVHFTQKEFALLQLLMLRKNTIMTKEMILANLYGGLDEPEIKIIDVFICKLRSKLAKAGVTDLIGTVWGRGYIVREEGRDNLGTSQPRIPLPIKARQQELAAV